MPRTDRSVPSVCRRRPRLHAAAFFPSISVIRGGVGRPGLVWGKATLEADGDMAGILLRADDGIAPEAVPGIREFGQFLETMACATFPAAVH